MRQRDNAASDQPLDQRHEIRRAIEKVLPAGDEFGPHARTCIESVGKPGEREIVDDTYLLVKLIGCLAEDRLEWEHKVASQPPSRRKREKTNA